MGKFANALGVLDFTVGKQYIELHPQMGDKRKLLRLSAKADKAEDPSKVIDEFYNFIVELFVRDHPDEDPKEIAEFVEANLMELINETLVGFRLTTKEALDKAYAGETKKK